MNGWTYKHRSIMPLQNELCKVVCEDETAPMHALKAHWMSDRSQRHPFLILAPDDSK